MIIALIGLGTIGASFLFRQARHKKINLLESEKDKLNLEVETLNSRVSTIDSTMREINRINSIVFDKSDVTKTQIEKTELLRKIEELKKIKQGLQAAYNYKKRKEEEEEAERRKKARAAALVASRSSSSSSYSSGRSSGGGGSWGGGGGGFSGGGSSGSW